MISHTIRIIEVVLFNPLLANKMLARMHKALKDLVLLSLKLVG